MYPAPGTARSQQAVQSIMDCCVCVYMYLHLHKYKYIRRHANIHHTNTHTYIYINMYTYICKKKICTCVYVCTQHREQRDLCKQCSQPWSVVCVCIYTHIHTNISTHINTHIYVYTHIFIYMMDVCTQYWRQRDPRKQCSRPWSIVCVYTHILTHIHTTYIHIHVHKYMY